MSFRRYCPNCEQKFEAPDKMSGQTIECPACKARITLDKIPPKGQDGTAIGIQIVKCPLCEAPRIDIPRQKYGDAKCRSCGTIIPLKPKPITLKQLAPGEYPNLDGYEIVRILGEGGMGAVYEAKQLRLDDRKVAIKVLTEDIANSNNLDAEIKALVKLSHPEIITIFDLISFDKNKAIVMEAVAGPHGDPLSLREIISKNGKLDSAATLKACIKIANALAFAHSQGVLHLDLKPENILVDHLGHLRIVDFGLAQFSEEKSGKTTIISMRQRSVGNAVFGTPGYMPPERNSKIKPDARQDIYSLGAIMYEMLIGDLPEGRFELPSERNPEMPGILDSLVEKSLNFHPERRYSSMEEFSEALENALKVVKAGANKNQESRLHIKKDPPSPPPPISANNPNISINDEKSQKKNRENSVSRKDPAFTCFIIAVIFMGFLALAALLAALLFSFAEKQLDNEDKKSIEEIKKEIVEIQKPQKDTPTPPTTPLKTDDVINTLKKTAETGAPEAQCKLAEYYLSGKDSPPNFTKAAQLLEKAAQQNNLRASFLLAELMKKGLVRNKNKMEALKLYIKAAEASDPEAMNKMGEFYLYGDSIAPFRDTGEAFKWFQKAAKKNNPKAIYNLGECYYYGLGTPKDCEKAVECYEKSAKTGDKHAQFALGKAYQEGRGVSKDINKARRFYSLSARQDFAPAKEALKKLNLE